MKEIKMTLSERRAYRRGYLQGLNERYSQNRVPGPSVKSAVEYVYTEMAQLVDDFVDTRVEDPAHQGFSEKYPDHLEKVGYDGTIKLWHCHSKDLMDEFKYISEEAAKKYKVDAFFTWIDEYHNDWTGLGVSAKIGFEYSGKEGELFYTQED